MVRAFAVVLALAATLGLSAAQGGGKVEVKGPHICCKQCVNVVGKILAKVEGVSEVKADIASKTVTFSAKDDTAANAGFKALIDGGFFGKASHGDKEIKLELVAPSADKVEVVTVKDVHVCCGMCVNAIKKVFPAATFDGKGPQKTVRIEGKALNAADVLESLHKAGFHGKVEK